MTEIRWGLWPNRTDAAWLIGVALVFSAGNITIDLAGNRTTGWAGPWAGTVLQVLLDLTLILLFRLPGTVTSLVLAGAVLMLASDLLAPGLLVPVRPLTLMTVPTITPVLLSQLARVLDRRRLLTLAGVLAVIATRPWNASWSTTPFGLLATALPVAIALYFEARRQLLSSLRDRAERAEREQHLLAEQATAAERRRLAGEMHDVVTHRLSLMVLHAGALTVVSRDEAVRASAEDIRREGALALDELRDLVGVLRNGAHNETRTLLAGEAGDPATLVAESASVGVPTELAASGDPALISPTIARTAYRVVQESLTNVRKHAPGSSATVELRYHPGGLDVEVRNTAPTGPGDPALTGSGSGAGLAGLRQRVELIGGRLEAAPLSGGGYRVNAILPAYVPTTEGTHSDPGGRRR
ncbi:sensor histidine kinase [Amycolatopsis sp. H20-H5]|uniref:sensor histidine kinase n=1 Tax=Amycolatopsis sp. H20-H5 TaxID=3046309 RepID=UPI002DBE30DF|nr:histidine kinase [Amycolatopsis sp. H20-H5]MEC3977471.1 histidine kinase [Amycolatopsis sp. H20-H5]